MEDLYPVTAPTTARKEAAQMARKAYNKRVARKTRANQVKKAATDAEANAESECFLSWPRSCGGVTGALAAMREAIACVEAHMAAFERILERKGPVAAAAAEGLTA
jgi:hypothetical protein